MAPFVHLDPAYAVYCEQLKVLPSATKGEVTIEQLRKQTDAMAPMEQYLDVAEEDRDVVHEGKNLKLTLFRPQGAENENLPVVIFYHGGGWIFGSKYTHGKPVREICVKSHVMVVFVDYSLGPKNNFPVAHEECFATLLWVLANGNDINADINKIAVCGDSAGGNLSASISAMAKKHGLENVIKTQVMIYPALTVASRRHAFESVKLFGTGDFGPTLEDSQFYDESYFDNWEKCKSSLPLNFAPEEMEGLPSALLITAEADILRDEGETYTRMLTKAGVPTVGIRIMGAIHGYFSLPFDTPAYRLTITLITGHLNATFNV